MLSILTQVSKTDNKNMQIGFDVGATKIESVVLEETGQENFRE